MKLSHPAHPACTAIVCAYNEEEHLASVLDGLLNASFIEEIIVVVIVLLMALKAF